MQTFEDTARNFIKYCRSKFRARDASTEVIMHIGGGCHLCCGNAILGEYPDVQSVIAIDNDPMLIDHLILRNAKIELECADIGLREELESFLGKMTKVFSIRTFLGIYDLQKLFENAYAMLRPGGEAAFLFYQTSMFEWFLEMIKIPKWKNIYQGRLCQSDKFRLVSTQEYKEMMQRIGFEVVECSEKENERPFETDTDCSDQLYKIFQPFLKVDPELLAEFKREALQVYENIYERDAKGRLVNITKDRILLLVKPRDRDL